MYICCIIIYTFDKMCEIFMKSILYSEVLYILKKYIQNEQKCSDNNYDFFINKYMMIKYYL